MSITLTGDWDKALGGLAGFDQALNRSAGRALLREAHGLRTEILRGLDDQNPGGKPFKPLSKWTLAFRMFPPPGQTPKGTKILARTGAMRSAVMAFASGLKAWVGVKRVALSAGGDTANIAAVQEFGAGPIIVPLTDKMHRMLMAVGIRAGIIDGKAPSTGTRKRVLMIRIPSRPFLRPAFETWKKGMPTRFKTEMAEGMRDWFQRAGAI